MHEGEHGVSELFEIDHFKPRAKFPELENAYGNLYYSCRLCNSYKKDFWPSAEDEAAGLKFIDPCEEGLLGEHAELLPCGTLKARTTAGEFTITHLGLNRRNIVKLRRERLEAIKMHYESVITFRETLSLFDDQLRDLRKEAGINNLMATRIEKNRAACENQLLKVLERFGPVYKPFDED
jgi:hypothetical protein